MGYILERFPHKRIVVNDGLAEKVKKALIDPTTTFMEIDGELIRSDSIQGVIKGDGNDL